MTTFPVDLVRLSAFHLVTLQTIFLPISKTNPMFQQILALINTYFLVFLNAIFINIFPTFKLMERNVVEKDS